MLATRESTQKNILKRIAALSESFTPESRNRLLRVLIRNNSLGRTYNGTKMALLLRIIRTEPNSWLTYFLAGELLHQEKEWELSTQYLHHALDLGSGKENSKIPNLIRIESLRLLGMNAYHKKDYAIAERIFSDVAADKLLSLGDGHEAKVWVDRCKWSRKQKP